MGDLKDSTTGDLSCRVGLDGAAEMLRESLGFATREASMLSRMGVCLMCLIVCLIVFWMCTGEQRAL